MKLRLMLAGLVLVSAAYAKDAKNYDSAKVVQMQTVDCQSAAKNAPSATSGDSQCREYVLESESLVYRVRARNDKRTPMLIVGQTAHLSIINGKMTVRMDKLGNKEHEFDVLSMGMREEATEQSTKLNHLQ
ncbi:MAG TPA: hypothetical protein VFI95_00320 [Terriglobales bacterium]|nr:hypothetical protein [Terriglobales bacterium]